MRYGMLTERTHSFVFNNCRAHSDTDMGSNPRPITPSNTFLTFSAFRETSSGVIVPLSRDSTMCHVWVAITNTPSLTSDAMST